MQPASVPHSDSSPAKEIQVIAETCNDCGICQEDCRFLQRYGTPGAIARAFRPRNGQPDELAFKCSLCQACTAVCPQGLDPSAMFHGLRRQAVAAGGGSFEAHQGICRFEQRGVSKRYTHYALPRGCDTVFFPGCALPGSRPETVKSVFRTLRRHLPHLGIVLDCCAKPSLDLGHQTRFGVRFQEMKAFLVAKGVKRVLTACPNCQPPGRGLHRSQHSGSVNNHFSDQPPLWPSASPLW